MSRINFSFIVTKIKIERSILPSYETRKSTMRKADLNEPFSISIQFVESKEGL